MVVCDMDKKKITHLITIGLIILFLSILVSYLIFNNNKHKETKKVLGASAIPMYTKEIRPKFFSAIPIYDLIINKLIQKIIFK